jgi:hypothetical protein
MAALWIGVHCPTFHNIQDVGSGIFLGQEEPCFAILGIACRPVPVGTGRLVAGARSVQRLNSALPRMTRMPVSAVGTGGDSRARYTTPPKV